MSNEHEAERTPTEWAYKYLREVPIQKFTTRVEEDVMLHSDSRPLSICLWGPPGCGKSSAMIHIDSLLNQQYIATFNRDTWNEFLASEYFRDEYLKLRGERSARARQNIFVSTQKELDFWTELMGGSFTALKEKPGNTLPLDPAEIFKTYFLKHTKDLLEDHMWHLFLHENEVDMSLMPLCSIFYTLGPWWARKTGVHFVLEISGNRFNEESFRKMFGTSNNLLYVPFIDDLHTIENRVSRRNQFGSPSLQQMASFYRNCYGNNLLLVLDSFMFSQIIIQGNNQLNYVMLSLERIQNRDGSMDYLLVKEYANSVHEAMYIKSILQSLFIPTHLHGAKHLVYSRGEWSLALAPRD